MRGMARWAGAVVVILVVAWGGLWWYTQTRLRDALANSAALQTTSNGNSVVAYDSISMGANPFVASATMNNIRWSLNTPGTDVPVTIGIGLAQAKIWIDVFHPLVMHIGLPNQILITTARGAGSINFGSFAASAGLNPRALFNRKIYALTSENLAVHDMDIVAGNNAVPLLHVDDIAGHESFNPAAGPGQTAISGQDSFDGIALTPVLVVLGHVPFDGKITHIGFSMELSGPADWHGLMDRFHDAQIPEQQRQQLLVKAIHGWAAAGGNGKASLTLVLGPSTLNAKGTVAFDASAQPSGTADIAADHLDAFSAAITAAYPQTQQDITDAETRLSPYLAATSAGGQVLNVHVVYGKAGVVVNGSRMADLPPIDWNKLETLPAQAAQ